MSSETEDKKPLEHLVFVLGRERDAKKRKRLISEGLSMFLPDMNINQSYQTNLRELADLVISESTKHSGKSVVAVVPQTHASPADGYEAFQQVIDRENVYWLVVGRPDSMGDDGQAKAAGVRQILSKKKKAAKGRCATLLVTDDYNGVVECLATENVFSSRASAEESDAGKKKAEPPVPTEPPKPYEMYRVLVCGFASDDPKNDLKKDLLFLISRMPGCEVYYTEHNLGQLCDVPGFREFMTQKGVVELDGFDAVIVGTRARVYSGREIVSMDGLADLVSILVQLKKPGTKVAVVYEWDRYQDDIHTLDDRGVFGELNCYAAESRTPEDLKKELEEKKKVAVTEFIVNPLNRRVEEANTDCVDVPASWFAELEFPADMLENLKVPFLSQPTAPGTAGTTDDSVITGVMKNIAVYEAARKDWADLPPELAQNINVYEKLLVRYEEGDRESVQDAVRAFRRDFPGISDDQLNAYFRMMSVLAEDDTPLVPVDKVANLLMFRVPGIITGTDVKFEDVESLVSLCLKRYIDGGEKLLGEGYTAVKNAADQYQHNLAKIVEGLAGVEMKSAPDKAQELLHKAAGLEDESHWESYLNDVVDTCSSEGKWADADAVSDNALAYYKNIEDVLAARDGGGSPDRSDDALYGVARDDGISEDEAPQDDAHDEEFGTGDEDTSEEDEIDEDYADDADDIGGSGKMADDGENKGGTPKKEDAQPAPTAPKRRSRAGMIALLATGAALVGTGGYFLIDYLTSGSGRSGLEEIADPRTEGPRSEFSRVPSKVAEAAADMYGIETFRRADADEDGYRNYMKLADKARHLGLEVEPGTSYSALEKSVSERQALADSLRDYLREELRDEIIAEIEADREASGADPLADPIADDEEVNRRVDERLEEILADPTAAGILLPTCESTPYCPPTAAPPAPVVETPTAPEAPAAPEVAAPAETSPAPTKVGPAHGGHGPGGPAGPVYLPGRIHNRHTTPAYMTGPKSIGPVSYNLIGPGRGGHRA
ncbi:hypothetical protein KY359_03135 [Candidatus Woesearchaeota archaeon]|nr:hypothetical protein [Candidatus Woesearchaeota archaeon]